MNARQDGSTIIEVVVAVVMLGIILTMLAGLTYTTARQAVRNNDTALQQAAMLEVVNRYSAIPYAEVSALNGSTTCDNVGSANAQFQRCVTVSAATRGVRVNVVVTPLQRGIPATSTQFARAAPATANPLCIGC